MAFQASNEDCRHNPMLLRCYLLDEHGYVIFSSDLRLGSTTVSSVSESGPSYAYFHSLPPGQRGPLGKFFGDLDAPERAIMKGLVAQDVYQEQVYVDFQAICPDEQLNSGGSRLLAPLYNLGHILGWLGRQLVLVFKEIGVWGFLYSFLRPIEAYTSSFRGVSSALPCDKASRFYILDYDKARETAAADVTTSNVCGSSGCSMYSYVAPVLGTNLLFVAFKLRTKGPQKTSECYTETCTAHSDAGNPKIEFQTVYNASDKIFTQGTCKPDQRHRRAPSVCYPNKNETEKEYQCAGASGTQLVPLLLLLPLLHRLVSL